MQLLGAPSAYLLLASCWYAALGCSECIPASGFVLVCSSWVLRVHTCFWPHVGMQLLGAPSAYLLLASCWYIALGCSECIPASGSALVCSSWVLWMHTRFRLRSG